MSGDWIKVQSDTHEKPEVLRLARTLSVSRTTAFGAVIIFWAWLDSHSRDGTVDGVVDGDVDGLVGIPGFCEAMRAIGWLALTNTGLSVPHFERMNGQTSKERSMKNERQARWRAGKAEPKPAKPLPKPRSNSPKANGEYAPEFLVFWGDYPRHEAKADAAKAWAKIAPDRGLQARILAAVAAQKECSEWRKEGGRYIPHPASWLNACRWEDETAPPPPRQVAI